MVVQGLTNEYLLFTATVFDYSDSLISAVVVPAESTGIPLSNPDNEGVATVENEVAALFVGWIGLPCQDRPSLQIRRDGDRLEIMLDKGPLRDDSCPYYPHYFALRLEFASPISISNVHLQLAD